MSVKRISCRSLKSPLNIHATMATARSTLSFAATYSTIRHDTVHFNDTILTQNGRSPSLHTFGIYTTLRDFQVFGNICFSPLAAFCTPCTPSFYYCYLYVVIVFSDFISFKFIWPVSSPVGCLIIWRGSDTAPGVYLFFFVLHFMMRCVFDASLSMDLTCTYLST